MLGTKHCDRCWELQTRIERDLVLTYKILEALKPKPVGPAAIKIATVKEAHAKEMRVLEGMAAILTRVPQHLLDKAHVYCEQLDFNNLTRAEAVEVMQALGAGKWRKESNEAYPTCIDYIAVIDGWTVRLWAAGPPESCRIIEVEELVPATTRTVRKLVCSGKETV